MNPVPGIWFPMAPEVALYRNSIFAPTAGILSLNSVMGSGPCGHSCRSAEALPPPIRGRTVPLHLHYSDAVLGRIRANAQTYSSKRSPSTLPLAPGRLIGTAWGKGHRASAGSIQADVARFWGATQQIEAVGAGG